MTSAVTPRLIIGLGNPDAPYANTRHNTGRLIIEAYLKEHNGLFARLAGSTAHEVRVPHFAGRAYRSRIGKADYVLVPDVGTFMNVSGEAIERVRSFFKIETEEILLVHDDIDLPLGAVRIAIGASAGGHNGVQSTITALGSPRFARLRIGIETRTNKSQPPADAFVLQPFPPEERNLIIQKGVAALTAVLTHGITVAMNTHNARSNG